MFLKVDKKEAYLLLIKKINSEIFKVSLVIYLLFYLIDSFKVGYINDYFDLNILLIIIIISGILTIISKKEGEDKIKTQEVKVKDYVFIIILGLVASVVIYFKIKGMGWLSYVISIISGIIIILISILLLNETEEDDQRSQD